MQKVSSRYNCCCICDQAKIYEHSQSVSALLSLTYFEIVYMIRRISFFLSESIEYLCRDELIELAICNFRHIHFFFSVRSSYVCECIHGERIIRRCAIANILIIYVLFEQVFNKCSLAHTPMSLVSFFFFIIFLLCLCFAPIIQAILRNTKLINKGNFRVFLSIERLASKISINCLLKRKKNIACR